MNEVQKTGREQSIKHKRSEQKLGKGHNKFVVLKRSFW